MNHFALVLFLSSTCLLAADCGCKKKSSDAEAKKQTSAETNAPQKGKSTPSGTQAK